MVEDFERCYAAVRRRDPRYDGWFVVGVRPPGRYCRPSCPGRTPRREHVRFFPSPAAAHAAGHVACAHCRPDAAPASPEWNRRAGLADRAMRLIAEGVLDRDDAPGLARRLGHPEREVRRALARDLGAGPRALAQAQRARTARMLIEETTLSPAEVALAAGFPSAGALTAATRRFLGASPARLRAAAGPPIGAPGDLTIRLPTRPPFAGAPLLAFLAARAVEGLEECDGRSLRRTLRLPNGWGVVALSAGDDHVTCCLRLEDLRDAASAVERCRRLLDLDADAPAIDERLAADPLLTASVAATPGLRMPGSADGVEMAVRAVIGQQISVRAARTLAGRLVARLGAPLPAPDGGLTHRFPSAEAIAADDPAALGIPTARARALLALCTALAEGRITVDPSADRAETRARLLALPGIGPWTADYLAMRALGDPDAFPVGDLGLQRALAASDGRARGRDLAAAARAWQPWRAYAAARLWAGAAAEGGTRQ